MNRHLVHLLCLILISGLAGCMTTRSVESPKGSQTMQEIYETHFESGSTSRSKEGTLEDFDDDSALSAEVISEIENTFPVLDNPMLIMYVFPHVATESRLPVPGYWTAIPMYERDEFAEPGEQASSKSAGN